MLFKIKALFLCVKTKAMETNIIERFHKNGGYLTRKEIRTEKQLYQLRRLTEEKIVKRIKPGVFFWKRQQRQK